MVAFSKQLLAAAAAVAFAQAHPLGGFRFSSLIPAWVTKRALYNLDSITDQDHKNKLTQGLKDAVTIAAKTLEKMDDDKHRPRLEFWFGDQRSDDNSREIIRQVYKNFVGDNTDGTGADVNGKIVVSNKDFWIPKKVGDGKTPFCDIDMNGKTGTAYFKNNRKVPSMHFCDKVWDRSDLAGLTANGCEKLGDHVSTILWTKNFIGANVLHEFMHFPSIGQDAIGEQIGDVIYDAFQCRQLAVDPDVNRRKNTLVNADTYVWYALDIAFNEICGKDFPGPRDDSDDDPTDQDWEDNDLTDDCVRTIDGMDVLINGTCLL